MSVGGADYRIVDQSIPAAKRDYWYMASLKCQPNFPKDRKVYTKRVAVTTNSKERAKELIMAKLKHLHPYAIVINQRHG